jgi:uncharacterized protein YndB with AHSA1/START domain
MSNSETAEVRLSQVFDAPAETVFAAFTEPDQISQWWGPHGFEAPREKIEIDLRVGGRFEVVMVVASEEIAGGMGVPLGAEFPDSSEIVELEAPRLIVLRSAAQPEIGLTYDSTTRIEFAEEGEGRTRVTIAGGPYTPEMAPNAQLGWQQQLEKLGSLLRGR